MEPSNGLEHVTSGLVIFEIIDFNVHFLLLTNKFLEKIFLLHQPDAQRLVF